MVGAPRNSLRPEFFVNAALDVARRGTVHDVSLRRLAGELGVSHMAVYRHFTDRSALVEAMIDEVMGSVDAPEPDPDHWASWIEGVALSIVHTLDDYPGLADEVLARVPNRLTPSGVALTNRCVDALTGAGIDRDTAGTAFLTMFAYILGAVRMRRRDDSLALADDSLPASIHATFGDEHFAIGLRLFIHGLRIRAPYHQGSPAPTG